LIKMKLEHTSRTRDTVRSILRFGKQRILMGMGLLAGMDSQGQRVLIWEMNSKYTG